MSKRFREDNSPWLYENEDGVDEEFTDEDLQNGLTQLITDDCSYGSEISRENLRVQTYSEAGVMTYDKGLVTTLPDGSEYQLTIIRSR